MHFTTKQTVSIDKEGGVILPEQIFNEVHLILYVCNMRAICGKFNLSVLFPLCIWDIMGIVSACVCYI